MKHIKCEFAQSGMACAYCGNDGFVEGTTILVESGWRNVANLGVDDLVRTLENGLQPIRQIEKTNVWKQPGTCPDSVCPLFVPAGALGNEEDMLLQGETMIAIASKSFEAQSGHLYALVQGVDLIDFIGIKRFQPLGPSNLYQLHFDHEELVPVGNGAVASCPSVMSVLNFDTTDHNETVNATTSGYPKLDHDQAKAFLAFLTQELADIVAARQASKSAS